MAETKTDKNPCERPIKIQKWTFDALLITRTTWKNLDSPSEIQRPRLNCNDSQSCIEFSGSGVGTGFW